VSLESNATRLESHIAFFSIRPSAMLAPLFSITGPTTQDQVIDSITTAFYVGLDVIYLK
jgi:hypothetical protein